MTYTPPPSPSPELRTALAFVDAVNAKDADALRALFAEDGTHQFYPPMAANPARSRDDFVDFFALSMKGLELHVTIHEAMEAPGKVWLYGSGTGKALTGDVYSNLYVFMIDLQPSDPNDGETATTAKITRLREFMDSAFFLDFAAKAGPALGWV